MSDDAGDDRAARYLAALRASDDATRRWLAATVRQDAAILQLARLIEELRELRTRSPCPQLERLLTKAQALLAKAEADRGPVGHA